MTMENACAQIKILQNKLNKLSSEDSPNIEDRLHSSKNEEDLNQSPNLNRTICMKDKKYLLPGDDYEITINAIHIKAKFVSVIPQFFRPEDLGPEWSPQICQIKDGHAIYHNNSGEPLLHAKGASFNTFPARKIQINTLNQTPKQ